MGCSLNGKSAIFDYSATESRQSTTYIEYKLWDMEVGCIRVGLVEPPIQKLGCEEVIKPGGGTVDPVFDSSKLLLRGHANEIMLFQQLKCRFKTGHFFC